MNIYDMKKPKRINSVSVLMALGLAFLGYLLYWWVPIMWPVFQMTGIMKSACSEAYRTVDDNTVVDKLVKDAQRTGLRIDKTNFRFRRVPYTGAEIKARDLVGKDFIVARGKHCEIDFRYQDEFAIPFTGRQMSLTFDRTVDATLEPVKYDKLCTCVRVPGGPGMLRER